MGLLFQFFKKKLGVAVTGLGFYSHLCDVHQKNELHTVSPTQSATLINVLKESIWTPELFKMKSDQLNEQILQSYLCKIKNNPQVSSYPPLSAGKTALYYGAPCWMV